MLDVHPVHGAVTGWRDFFVHIVIIAIGLCLAISLEETVKFIHNRFEIAETRRALRQEREENHERLMAETKAWRWGVAELQNNLMLLQYLQQHPGTPREKLPGVLIWSTASFGISSAVWDAAGQSGVLALMPREEIEQNSTLYEVLHREAEHSFEATVAVREAERYDLVDPDPSHLSPEQIAAEIELVQTALGKQWLHGVLIENLVESFPDFPATVTRAELHQLRHYPDAQTTKLLGPAHALTMERLKAAGYVDMDSQLPRK